ncbi:MAG TPA: hypothetical protein VMU83_14320 [Hanamia sp.]|nr:hypothetical protein [Hanamia sp.]
MKKKQVPQAKTGEEILPEMPETTLVDIIASFPPGTKLSDVFIDMEDLTTQLKFSKRTVNNMRKAGHLSSTFLVEKGKVFFFVQELAAILNANAVIGKNSLLKKKGIIKMVTTITGLFSLLPFDADALACFVCLT